MNHKYGGFSNKQMNEVKQDLRKSIFFLLLCVDPNTKNEFQNINLEDAFNNVLYKTAGLNSLLNEPKEIVEILSLLEYAKNYVLSDKFEFMIYRKLILDAGSKVLCIGEE